MFERFTEQAVNAMTLAEEEARRLGHNFVGTEQILLGLIGEGTAIAARTLASFGLYVKNVRTAVESIDGYGSGIISRQIPFTPRAQRALALAAEQAEEWRLEYIGAEHILLGLLGENEGAAVRVLRYFGVEPAALRDRVVQVINGVESPEAAEPLIPVTFADVDDQELRALSREEALLNLYGLYSFIKADSVPPEMLGWLEDRESILGVYLNAEDDYLVICENGLHWYNGEAKSYLDYKSIVSVALPSNEEERYLRLVLRPNHKVSMLPVLHETEDYPDLPDMYEFLSYTIRSPIGKINVQDIRSRDDFISFLRQPDINTGGFASLASWLEEGAPNSSWLDTLKIAPETLEDPSVWRLLALVFLRFPECART